MGISVIKTAAHLVAAQLSAVRFVTVREKTGFPVHTNHIML